MYRRGRTPTRSFPTRRFPYIGRGRRGNLGFPTKEGVVGET